MAQEPTRRLWSIVLKNFIDSFKPRQLNGTLKGTDYMGNKYYEVPKSSNKQRTSRWFEPPEKDNFLQEVPAEWEAWLRGNHILFFEITNNIEYLPKDEGGNHHLRKKCLKI